MEILYVNNFRNFFNSFIEIRDVNFLVGENSTGKTSILALLNLFSNPNFWSIYPSFNNSEYQFGYFNEIAQKDRCNGKFDIGIFYGEDQHGLKCLKITYQNIKGRPRVCRYAFVVNNYDVEVVYNIKSNTVKKHYKKIDVPKENQMDWFEKWISVQKQEGGSNIKIDPRACWMAFPLMKELLVYAINGKYEDGLTLEQAFSMFETDVCWIAPIRAKAKRVYSLNTGDTPEGDHAPYRLKEMMLAKNDNSVKKENLNKFGNESNLFDSIEICPLRKSEEAPFEINIVLNKQSAKMTSVGQGVTQVLPIVTEMLTRTKTCMFLLQQPEVHLHPRAQATFGELLFDLYKLERKSFVIETHSDFIIDRFRLCQNKEKINKFDAQVIFFERNDEGNKASSIAIDLNGRYQEEQPISFREFFINESIALLEV